MSWASRHEWEFTGQRGARVIAGRGCVTYKDIRGQLGLGAGVVLRDEARQVGRGWITAGFSKAKFCKGLLEFKAMEWSSQIAFSKDISGCPVESGLAGARLEAGGFHCGQARARGWLDWGDDKGHGEEERGLRGLGNYQVVVRD